MKQIIIEYLNSIYNDKVAIALISGFVGSGTTFILFRLGNWLDYFYERNKKNYNSLVGLIHMLNIAYDKVNQNIYVINSHKATEQDLENGKIYITTNRLNLIPFNENASKDLYKIKFIDDLSNLSLLIGKLNDDVNTLNGTFNNVTNLLIEKKMAPQNYVEFYDRYKKDCSLILGFLNECNDQLFECIAKTTVLSNEGIPLFTLLMRWLKVFEYSKSFKKKVEKEKEKMKKAQTKNNETIKIKISKIVEEANK